MNVTTENIKAEKNVYPFTIWKFTGIDRACLSMVIRGTWIFDVHLDTDRMKTGLGRLLNYYPHLSGRMKDGTGIHLTNDGVSFTVSSEPGLLTADVYKMDNPIKYCSMEIRPSRIKRGIDAPLSIKITHLKDGSVLGIQCSHACMDGESFYTMVYNWGQLCKKADFNTPVLDQSLVPVPENLSRNQVIQTVIDCGWKKVSLFSFFKLFPALISGVLMKRTKAFYFSTRALNELKQKISDEAGCHCSINVALSAFISKMCIKLFRHAEETKCTQVTVVNIRNRLAGIPSTFTGNASSTIPSIPFPAGSGIGEIARGIHQTLEPFLKIPSEELKKFVMLNVTAYHFKLPWVSFDFSEMFTQKPTVVYINNFSKLHIYDIDFGLGGPVLVIPHDLMDQVLVWPAHPSKGGVEVYFAGIPAHGIDKLKEGDPWLEEIRQYGH